MFMAYSASAIHVASLMKRLERPLLKGHAHGLLCLGHVCLDLCGLTNQEDLEVKLQGPGHHLTCLSHVCLDLCVLSHQVNLEVIIARSRAQPIPTTAMSVLIYVASLIKRIQWQLLPGQGHICLDLCGLTFNETIEAIVASSRSGRYYVTYLSSLITFVKFLFM